MHDPSADRRQARIAQNEARFRLINERLEADLRRLCPTSEPQPFICECGSRSCQESVSLNLAEYEAVRRQPDHFAVLPHHVFSEAERVVERHERYFVVEKLGVAAIVSELTDPRGEDASDAALFM